jgi:endonuclease/exonuclease/phosphatase (EEP) superfamily protein YafD
MQRLTVFIILLSISAFGCVIVPDTLTVESRSGKFDSLPADYLCNREVEHSYHTAATAGSKGFNASGFSLLSWNIQKEIRAGWESDFVRLSQNVDILVIQEAHLTEQLRQLLNHRPYYWHLVTAFEYQDAKTGVLTAATIEPDFVCPLRATEPLIGIPKTILMTRYPLTNRRQSLMIANIHMINFAPHVSAFENQVRQMTEILVDHQGPMILAGDFNSWSEERLAIIENMTVGLQLKSADFKTDTARKVFGYTIDRVYYRGLTLEEAWVIEVTSSDHNPLLLRFRLNRES